MILREVRSSEYKVGKKNFDIISGGSGFHQILTLLSFVYGYPEVTTILFDEPDAHLHVNLQRQIADYFRFVSNKQIIIATHSEELIKGVEMNSILSILSGKPQRVESTNEIILALSDVKNIEIIRTEKNPYILYIEGENDQRLLAIWAGILGKLDIYEKFYPFLLHGTSKNEMKVKSDKHFKAIKLINLNIKRAILFDQDGDDNALNPPSNQKVLNEWKRKNIENYLLIPSVWKNAISKKLNEPLNSLLLEKYNLIVENFFNNENLFLPPNNNWKNVSANIFKVLDGKKLLFENENSLFQQLKKESNNELILDRSYVAQVMTVAEIHQDIEDFFENLSFIVNDGSSSTFKF